MIQFIEKHKKLEEQKRLIDLAHEQRSHTMETRITEGLENAKKKMERDLKLRALNVMKKHELLEKRVDRFN
jgi:hypothetical protein